MTDKEKMAQIIAEHLCPQGKAHKTLYGAERRCYSRDNFAECEKVSKCVDALIAAGIGDVSELQKECDSKEEAYNKCYFDFKHWKDKAKEYKHRAEVYEEMFDVLYEDTSEYMRVLSKEWYKHQAEKKIAEEKKK